MLDLLPILQKKGLLDQAEVSRIAEEVREGGHTLDEVLRDHGVSDADVLTAKGEYWNIPVRSIATEDVSYDILKFIPEESAKHYKIIPIAMVDGVLDVGVVDPDNIDALDALNFISTREGVPFKVFLISYTDYERALGMYQGFSGTVSMALSELESEESHEGKGMSVGESESRGEDLDDLDATIEAASKKSGDVDYREQAPITKIVSTILRSAIETRASDIHVEPERDRMRVRFRVDGVLNESLVLPSKVKRAVVARIKILAGIKLDERRKPQDGRFSATIAGRRVDFRVSTFPTYFGEKVVLRILDSEGSKVTLADLGMDVEQLAAVKRAIAAPYGIILITGPTGSGKSTTLYAMLNEVDCEGKNALSLEDPVEYNIKGVSQSQMRPEIGYTFASGIRSVLRQDPDIIMIGEIRDKETAQLAVQAALTGHLVFSTLHTNNAIGAVPRLIDMGVDPFLLAPTLQLIVAQRLVRKICPDTGKNIPIEGALKKMIDHQFADLPEKYRSKIPESTEFLGIQPSNTCPAGTRGRLGVYEMLEATDEIKNAVLAGSPEGVIMQIARKNGMITLKEDAIIKAMKKMVPFEEIAQVGLLVEQQDESPEDVESLERESVAGEDVPHAPIDVGMEDLV
ncbi:MAG: type II/IV secretion system protein [Candidatus Pacebacteria bacterium]|nr:type II/IV secretion system protein [Candidatus Paceibacterota bacterium]